MVIPSTNIFLDKNFLKKDDVIHYIADEADKLEYTQSSKDLFNVFKEREKDYSTGLQEGFAIPHAKSRIVKKPGIIYVRSNTGIEWETYDNQAVTDVFALMVPDKDVGTIHLQMLSNLATALLDDDFKLKLRNLNDKGQISEFITKQIGETIS